MKHLIVLACIFFGLILLRNWAVEYLWFLNLGYDYVFWFLRLLKISSFVLSFILIWIFCWLNVRRITATIDLTTIKPNPNPAILSSFQPTTTSGAIATHLVKRSLSSIERLLLFAAFAISLIAAISVMNQWDTTLRYLWHVPYGQKDPIFGKDIGFYLFQLPFLDLIQDTLLQVTFLVSCGLIAFYAFANVLQLDWKQGLVAPTNVIRHIAMNLMLFLVTLSLGYFLDRYEVLQSTRGVVSGAGYTDLHIVLPVLWLLVVATSAMAVALLIPSLIFTGRRVLHISGGYLSIVLLGLGLLPWIIQQFHVRPNELQAEQEYLKHNIAMTLEGYGLNHVIDRHHDVQLGITSDTIQDEKQTVENIRLWDWRPLGETFRQLQQIRSYYTFGDVDVDRYRIDGSMRQVMLATRELADNLPRNADTWLNQHLQYTHGYGVAMSLAAEKDPQGGPILVIKDLPPKSAEGLSLDRPEVYFSDKSVDYRLVSTSVPEFDFPKGDENVYSTYQGSGGILVDSIWKKLLFSWHQMDVSIAISDYITPESRLQLWRNIKERIQKLAPFLQLDKDPYPVISDGSIYWIQDAYTVSTDFPYSESIQGNINYIRNSVKIVVDAYNGNVVFYTTKIDDPVLRVYQRALPRMFKSDEEMTESLRSHIRYPQDLFEVQTSIYSRYHMKTPQVFYNAEDQWAAPRESYAGKVIDMKPYYVLMKLPQENKLQFLLMTPLTPYNRDNLIAWMAARSDYTDFGELFVYKLPKERLIVGPKQIEAMIDQDTTISQQLSLWDQRGSRVIRGNLLVIPIAQTFLYVEPVYLIADTVSIPQLKRVIVSDGKRLAMEPTLEHALDVVLNQQDNPQAEAQNANPETLDFLRDTLTSAEESLRQGDWDGFGKAMQKIKAALAE